jgi:hypothetical protein
MSWIMVLNLKILKDFKMKENYLYPRSLAKDLRKILRLIIYLPLNK